MGANSSHVQLEERVPSFTVAMEIAPFLNDGTPPAAVLQRAHESEIQTAATKDECDIRAWVEAINAAEPKLYPDMVTVIAPDAGPLP